MDRLFMSPATITMKQPSCDASVDTCNTNQHVKNTNMQNREIKFRVFDKVDHMTTFDLNDLIANKVQFTSDCPVMQCIGLVDDYGVEIYEDDIVIGVIEHPVSQRGNKVMGVVLYYNKEARFRIVSYGGGEAYTGFQQLKEFEVIGNIYENQGLLNSEQELA
jgi:uncharacterized phage protein (TIGR01671 family)